MTREYDGGEVRIGAIDARLDELGVAAIGSSVVIAVGVEGRSAPGVLDAVVQVAASAEVPVLVAAGYPWLSEGLQIGELALFCFL